MAPEVLAHAESSSIDNAIILFIETSRQPAWPPSRVSIANPSAHSRGNKRTDLWTGRRPGVKDNPPASYGAHQPPGVATGWKLPPPEHKMVFAGMASGPLCTQLKDHKQNGEKDLAALFHHVSGDPLVLWGWSPGYGRKPVPISHAEFVQAFRTWMDAGAPCPQARTASAR